MDCCRPFGTRCCSLSFVILSSLVLAPSISSRVPIVTCSFSTQEQLPRPPTQHAYPSRFPGFTFNSLPLPKSTLYRPAPASHAPTCATHPFHGHHLLALEPDDAHQRALLRLAPTIRSHSWAWERYYPVLASLPMVTVKLPGSRDRFSPTAPPLVGLLLPFPFDIDCGPSPTFTAPPPGEPPPPISSCTTYRPLLATVFQYPSSHPVLLRLSLQPLNHYFAPVTKTASRSTPASAAGCRY